MLFPALLASEPPYIYVEEFFLDCLSKSLRYAQEMLISKRIKALSRTLTGREAKKAEVYRDF